MSRRSVYIALAKGASWSELTWTQRRRWQRDQFYRSAHSRPGRGFVEVDKQDVPYTKAFAAAKSLHRARDSATVRPSHSLRLASLAAAREGHISSAQQRQDSKANQIAGLAKHTYVFDRPAAAGSCSLDAPAVAGPTCDASCWADKDVEDVPTSWEDCIARPASSVSSSLALPPPLRGASCCSALLVSAGIDMKRSLLERVRRPAPSALSPDALEFFPRGCAASDAQVHVSPGIGLASPRRSGALELVVCSQQRLIETQNDSIATLSQCLEAFRGVGWPSSPTDLTPSFLERVDGLERDMLAREAANTKRLQDLTSAVVAIQQEVQANHDELSRNLVHAVRECSSSVRAALGSRLSELATRLAPSAPIDRPRAPPPQLRDPGIREFLRMADLTKARIPLICESRPLLMIRDGPCDLLGNYSYLCKQSLYKDLGRLAADDDHLVGDVALLDRLFGIGLGDLSEDASSSCCTDGRRP